MSPGFEQIGYRAVDYRAPLIFDAKTIAADDLADLLGRHSALSRSLENSAKGTWCDRYNGTGTAFAKERIFGRRSFRRQTRVGTHLRRTLRRSREAGFRQSYSNAAVAHVMRRTHRSGSRKRDQAFLQTLFGPQVNSRRLTRDNAPDGLGVLGGREFTLSFL